MSDDRAKLLARIKALMAKTTENGCTMAEAMLALSKVQDLRDNYDVTDEELADKPAVVIKPSTHANHYSKLTLGVAVAKFCNVKVWEDETEKLIKFCGMPADVELADYLLETLAAFVQRELMVYMMADASMGARRRQRIRGFQVGCSLEICRRLNALCAQPAPARTDNSRALVVKGQALIETFLRDRGATFTGPRQQRARVNGDARAAGQAAGERASLGRPIGPGAKAGRIE